MIDGINFTNRDNYTQRKLIVLDHTIISEIILGIKFTKIEMLKVYTCANISINTITMKSISIKGKKYSSVNILLQSFLLYY